MAESQLVRAKAAQQEKEGQVQGSVLSLLSLPGLTVDRISAFEELST